MMGVIHEMSGISLPVISLPIITLGAIHAIGVQCMYGLVYRNGYLSALRRLYVEGPFVLPGSTNPVLTQYTGIKPLDNLLALANVLFANILDGSTPQSSLYSFQFAGQLVPLFSLLSIEGSRKGTGRSISSWSVAWGCLMQGLGYGFVMPIYCIAHLSSSPKVSSSSLEQHGFLQVHVPFAKLPVAMGLGYILPTILMSAPLSSNVAHQWFTGLWQGAPVWIYLFRLILEKNHVVPQRSAQTTTITERQQRQNEVNQATSFAYWCAAFTQLSTFGVLAFKNYLPLSPATRAELTFNNVFVPPRPWAVERMPNMAVGIMNFFHYDQYIGSLAGLFWATVLHRRTTAKEMSLGTWGLKIVKIYASGIVAGPVAVILNLIQDRDILLLERTAKV